MKLMTYQQGDDWLRGIGVNVPWSGSWEGIMQTCRYRIPPDSGRKTALSHLLVSSVFTGHSIIFVIQEHGVWPSCENETLFLKYRSSVSDEGGIDEYPFHIAQPDEAEYVEGLLALSLYFIWGILLLNDTGDVFIRTSHDEWIEVASHDRDRLMAMTKLLDEFGLEKM